MDIGNIFAEAHVSVTIGSFENPMVGMENMAFVSTMVPFFFK